MASGTYNSLGALAAGAGVAWTSATQRILLVKSSYTYDPDHATVADVAADELAVSGYSRQTLGSCTVTTEAASNRVVLDAADVSFGSLATGETLGGAVIFKRVGGSDASTDPLIAFLDLTDTPTNSAAIGVAFNASGIARITVG